MDGEHWRFPPGERRALRRSVVPAARKIVETPKPAYITRVLLTKLIHPGNIEFKY
jgi:hypothetical protein